MLEEVSHRKQATILLGVTGGVAAYKACEIVRALQRRGMRVKVIMTKNAAKFVGPMTFQALTNEPVSVDLFDEAEDPIHHITLAHEADILLIAPCTANVMAKLAHGLADDLLTTTALACTAPLIIAPAMNVHMYTNSATCTNKEILEQRGVSFVEPAVGRLACGDEGLGKLADTNDIVAAVEAQLARLNTQDLTGLKILITAGPTQEPIDPVRYITNESSGKMGYAIAQAAQQRGAEVTLISGPVSLTPPPGIECVFVRTAVQMLEATKSVFKNADILICTAAVADMRPATPSTRKLKKGSDDTALHNLELTENPDILATLSAQKTTQTIIGFAAETENLLVSAQEKLKRKGADIIVANDVSEGKVFGSDITSALILSSDEQEYCSNVSKLQLAQHLLDAVLAIREEKH